MEHNHIWLEMVILPVVVQVSLLLKPTKKLAMMLYGRSDQQMNPMLGDQLNMKTKYSSSTFMGQNHIWTHVAVLKEIMAFKPAQVLTVIGGLHLLDLIITELESHMTC